MWGLSLSLFWLVFELVLLVIVGVALLLLEVSRGVPRPSVFKVSTLLAREKSKALWEWEERFEGARPRSWRRRR